MDENRVEVFPAHRNVFHIDCFHTFYWLLIQLSHFLMQQNNAGLSEDGKNLPNCILVMIQHLSFD